jgi:hypothetical protein
LSHGTCSYICMYINAVADSVMLYLQHEFYNIIFKITHKLYIASRSAAPPPPRKKSGARLPVGAVEGGNLHLTVIVTGAIEIVYSSCNLPNVF